MRTLAQRRIRNLTLAVIGSIVIVLAWWVMTATLVNVSLHSGVLLTALLLLLAGYNLRKKLAFLPLVSSTLWLQIHIYAGMISVLVFCIHIGLRRPDGRLEILLAALYAVTALSGMVGILITRLYARRLAQCVEEVLYERIPVFRAHLRDSVRELALQSVRDSDATTLSDFCVGRLVPYFDRPRSFWVHAFGARRGSHPLVHEALALQRYLTESERSVLDEIIEHIRIKDDLDFQYALQTVLKVWLFVHIPFTYGLLAVSLVHIWLVFAFAGG